MATVLLVFMIAPLYAQHESISTRQKIEELLNRADQISEPSKARPLYKEALELGLTSSNPEAQIHAYTKLGLIDFMEDDNNGAIKNASRALRVYEEYDRPELNIVGANNLMSMALEKFGAYSDAIHHRKQSLKWQKTYPDLVRDKLAAFYSLNSIGKLYMELGQYDSSLYYFQLSVGELKEPQLRRQGSVYNNIGLVYTKMQQSDSAQNAFNFALFSFESIENKSRTDSFMIAVVRGNLADCLPDSSKLKEKYYLKDIEGSLRTGNAGNAVFTYNDLADYLIRTGQYAKAETTLKKSLLLQDSIRQQTPDSRIECYRLLTSLYIHTGKEDLALENAEKLWQLQDSLYGRKARNNFVSILTTYRLNEIENELTIEHIEGEKKKAEIEVLNKENRIARLRYTMLIVGSVLVVIVLLLLVLKIRSDAKRKAREKELRNRLLRMELEYNSDRLNKSVLSLSRKKEFAEELIQRISAMKDMNPSDRNALRLFVLNELEIDESIIRLEKDIHEVGEELISKLRMKFPNLSENDIRLLGFIKMELSNKQIAEIRNISPQSVKIAKNRLRKKLNIEAGGDFEALLSD